MKYSIKFALMALVSPLAMQAAISSFLPEHNAVYASEQSEHAEGEGEEQIVNMSDQELRAAGVVTALVVPRTLAETVSAPGEITINQYATSQVTPRIDAQIVTRHARMGDLVKQGQPLVTLSSVEMADAQVNLLLTDLEWRRTQKLGRDVVSEQRYIEAQIAAQQARAKAIAFGMNETQIKTLLANGDATSTTGEFYLLARQDGTVIQDEFVVGQFIEPGDILFEVSDETRIWVEARLSPEKAALIRRGAKAWVTEDAGTISGIVVQVHHKVDEATRTLSVRIEVNNEEDMLHAGEFANVEIQIGETAPVVAVPNGAIVLLGGQQVVFKREEDRLYPVEIDTGMSKGGWTEAKAGLFGGDEIVVENAFLIKSLILKSSIGDNH